MAIINYVTLDNLKLYLGITDTSQDALLGMLMDSSYLLLNKLLGIDTFNLTTADEQILKNSVYVNRGYGGESILVKNSPIGSINSIGGTAYTGASGTDYLVTYNRKLTFTNLVKYIPTNAFNVFTINYTWGYFRDELNNFALDELPADIALLQMMLISGQYAKRTAVNSGASGAVKKYILGDETVEFSDNTTTGGGTGTSADEMFFSFKILLDKYKIFILN